MERGVPKSTLVACHGGDFGLFEKMDENANGEVNLAEWMAYINRTFMAKSRGETWLRSVLEVQLGLELGLGLGLGGFSRF